MPLTSPPRTIVDLAALLGAEDLERLVAEASYRRMASEGELLEQLERSPGRRGNARLRSVLDLPGGRIHGFEVDVLWRELRFAVEIDGYEAHSSRVAFERDPLKSATLKAHGLDVKPVTPRQLRRDPAGVLSRLIRALNLADDQVRD